MEQFCQGCMSLGSGRILAGLALFCLSYANTPSHLAKIWNFYSLCLRVTTITTNQQLTPHTHECFWKSVFSLEIKSLFLACLTSWEHVIMDTLFLFLSLFLSFSFFFCLGYTKSWHPASQNLLIWGFFTCPFFNLRQRAEWKGSSIVTVDVASFLQSIKLENTRSIFFLICHKTFLNELQSNCNNNTLMTQSVVYC